MAFPNGTEQFAVIHKNFSKAIEKTLAAQIDMEIAFAVGGYDPRSDFKEPHKIFQQTLVDYEQAMANHLVKLKTRLNSLICINRLPIEILSRIVIFTALLSEKKRWGHYISYTWVCHHWRSALIQTANLWTALHLNGHEQEEPTRFRELLSRSKAAKLDISMTLDFRTVTNRIMSALEDLARESHRIHALSIDVLRPGDAVDSTFMLAFQNKRFPSLRRIYYNCSGWESGHGLLPVINGLDHLESFEFNFWPDITANTIDQITPVFSHTARDLHFHFHTPESLQLVLNSLHNSIKLQHLRINMTSTGALGISSQTLLPELQFLSCDTHTPSLLQAIIAPKLSSLDLLFRSPVTPNLASPILGEFHIASTQYLHIMDRPNYRSYRDSLFSIMGMKEPIHPRLGFLEADKERQSISTIEQILDEIIFTDDRPHGMFRIQFVNEDAFFRTVKGPLFLLLPRLTNLSEISLLSHTVLGNKEFHLDEFLAQVSSLQKLNILYYNEGLMVFIRILTTNTSLCPRLEQLSYGTSYFDFQPQKTKTFKGLGEHLTECVRTRREIYDGALRYIAVGKCPPLSGTWLRELQKLGTTVVTQTEEDFESGNILFQGSESLALAQLSDEDWFGDEAL